MRNSLSLIQINHFDNDRDLPYDHFVSDKTNQKIHILNASALRSELEKGATLFMQGQPANGVYVLSRGRIKLFTTSKDGRIIILNIAEPGELLGLSSSITNTPHIATAEAIDDCLIEFISYPNFMNFLRTNAETCLNAISQLSRNCETAYFRLCTLGLSATVAEKLAILFLEWCKADSDGNENIRLTVTYTHEEIGQMIGTSRESVTRMLKIFKDRKLIYFKGSDYLIYDRNKFEQSVQTWT